MARNSEAGGNLFPGRNFLRLARGLWVLVAAVAVLIFLLGLGPLFSAVSVLSAPPAAGLANTEYLDRAYRVIQAVGTSPTAYASFEVGLFITVFGLFLFIAGIIFWRRPDDSLALLVSTVLLFMGMTVGQDVLAFGLARFSLDLSSTLITIINAIGWDLFVVFLFLFPDGRAVPRWTRWVLLLWLIISLFPESWFQAGALSILLTAYLLGGLAVAAVAQLYRYRRVSTPFQRQQTKWVAFGLVLFIAISLVTYPFINSAQGIWVLDIVALSLAILPITIGIAILRYRLYDIDIIIRRTLVYGLVTATLIAVYFGSVVLLQNLFAGATGQQSPVAIVISTLIIAALFNPLRRRVQDFIDRRFYRTKYDAQKTLARFARTARDETDLEELTAELLKVVEETLRPEHVSVWLKTPGFKENK